MSLQFSSATYSVGEAGTTATITATRAGTSVGAVSVDYTTSDGTAIEGSDYTLASGTLTWIDGDTADQTFTVPISEDGLAEGNETINLTLSAATGGESSITQS